MHLSRFRLVEVWNKYIKKSIMQVYWWAQVFWTDLSRLCTPALKTCLTKIWSSSTILFVIWTFLALNYVSHDCKQLQRHIYHSEFFFQLNYVSRWNGQNVIVWFYLAIFYDYTLAYLIKQTYRCGIAKRDRCLVQHLLLNVAPPQSCLNETVSIKKSQNNI